VAHLVRSRYARVIEALPEPDPETTKYGLNPSVTFTKGTPIMLDPAGSLFAAIGSGNIKAFTALTFITVTDWMLEQSRSPAE
jgi:hypothetical protein